MLSKSLLGPVTGNEGRIHPSWFYRIGSLALFFGLWNVAAHRVDDPLTLPSPALVGTALWNLLTGPELFPALWTTLEAFAMGFGLALIVGIPLGLLIGYFLVLYRLTNPYLAILLSTPIAPIVPIVIAVFGLGLSARVFVIFFFSVAVIIINTATGVSTVDRNLIEMSRSFRATALQTFRKIILPGSVPAIMAGVRLGVGRAVVGMVVAELIIVTVGLGELIMKYTSFFQTANLIASVIVVLFVGFAIIKFVERLERHLLRWQTYRP